MRTIIVHYDEKTGELLTDSHEDAAFLNEKIRGKREPLATRIARGQPPAYFYPIRTQ